MNEDEATRRIFQLECVLEDAAEYVEGLNIDPSVRQELLRILRQPAELPT